MMFVSHHNSLVRAVFLFALACVTAAPTAAQLPRACIGMVLDGPSDKDEQGLSIFEREITELLEGEFDVSLPADKRLVADHTAEGVKAAMDQLLADPEVDFLLALGALSSIHACRRSELPKPVIAPFVDSASLPGIPLKDGASGRENLSYVEGGTDPVEDVRRFL